MKIGLIKKKKERCVAQQRVDLTKKEGIFFKSFAKQTDTFGLSFQTSVLNDVPSSWCRLRTSRDECLLCFMGIRIRSLPPRKPMGST